GAFTGADSRKLGLLETAQGGTVFLDEISSLSPALQVKLLRVLQERELRRVGGQELISINIRVISATNDRLEKLVEEGRFRSDLYYRLNVITITLPPLRERPEDIPLLAEHFLAALNRENKGDVAHVSAEAMDLLQRYSWPGNVREMQNVIERGYWLTDSKVIIPADLPTRLREATQAPIGLDANLTFADAKKGVLELFERDYLSRMLGECDGNVSKAARRAGMHRSSFQRLLKRYGIHFR
ncbi:MAG: sigma 54-interacting transcriptional regulator, partial [bacterium]|nr:sigma 54-interacting transcriptional regulator [bacterium]